MSIASALAFRSKQNANNELFLRAFSENAIILKVKKISFSLTYLLFEN